MKRGQISLFLIVAVVLAFVFFALFSLFKGGSLLDSPTATQSEIDSFTQSVQQCLENSASDSLFLLGKQGGKLYKHQVPFHVQEDTLEVIFLDIEHGILYGEKVLPYEIDGKWYNVSYGIEQPVEYGINYALPPPAYPYTDRLEHYINGGDWLFQLYFPYRDAMQASLPALCEDEGINGILPDSGEPRTCETYDEVGDSRRSIQAYMKNFIKHNMDECIDMIADTSRFEKFEITHSRPIVTPIIGEEDVSFYANLNVTFGDVSLKSHDFFTKRNIRIKAIHEFATHIIKRDISDPFFDLVEDAHKIRDCQSPKPTQAFIKCMRDNMTIERFENVCLTDPLHNDLCTYAGQFADMIVITDRESMLNGKPYKFVFGVENRRPALDYIHMTDGTFYEKDYDVLAFQGSKIVIDPFGFDPDDERKGNCLSGSDRCMDARYTYELWKADYEEHFTFNEQNTMINGLIDYETASTIPIEPFPFKLEPGEYPNSNNPSCYITDDFCPLKENRWHESDEYQLTGRTAGITVGEMDAGPHLLRVSVYDQENLIDYQDVKILVIPLTGGGQSDYEDINPKFASLEDSYTMQLDDVFEEGTGDTLFIWRDSRSDPGYLGEVDFDYNPPDSEKAKLELIKSIDTPSDTSFKENENEPMLDPFERLRLDINEPLISRPFDLDLRYCLPHGNEFSAPYPYNSVTSLEYYSPSEDPFFADHACCVGLGYPSPDTYEFPELWGTYETEKECFSYTDRHSFYALMDSYDYGSQSFNEKIYPADLAVGEEAISEEGPPNLVDTDVVLTLIGTLPEDPLDMRNDIVQRTLSQVCSGNRGNACSGTVTDSGIIIPCSDKDPGKNEIASCEVACDPDDINENCNRYNIEYYDGEIGFNGGCFYYSPGDSFEKNFMDDHSLDILAGICNPTPKCSLLENSYDDDTDEVKTYLNIGQCYGGGCKYGISPSDGTGGDCSLHEGYQYLINGPDEDGMDRWFRYKEGCKSNDDLLNEDFCTWEAENAEVIDVDSLQGHCDAVATNEELYPKLDCPVGTGNSCWLPSGSWLEFGNYTLQNKYYEEGDSSCCGDDEGEVYPLDYSNPNYQFTHCCPLERPMGNSNS
ncbi:hypothetical protein N9934_01875, partial [Desulfosarcina sp.]|nr:hypothetical protein [Desulfosarcina sp.]